MRTTEKPTEEAKPSRVVGSFVPHEVAECIFEDARKEERTPSRIVCRVLEKHYAKRVKAMKAATKPTA